MSTFLLPLCLQTSFGRRFRLLALTLLKLKLYCWVSDQTVVVEESAAAEPILHHELGVDQFDLCLWKILQERFVLGSVSQRCQGRLFKLSSKL